MKSVRNDRLDRIEKIIEKISIENTRLERESLKLQERQKKTDEQVAKVSQEVAKVNADVGKLTDGWGRFVEGLVAPAIPKTFKELGITILGTHLNSKRHKDGETMEIDLIAVGKDNIVLLSSIKSRLRRDDVEEFLKGIDRFPQFFDEYKKRKIIGLVAGIRIDEGVDRFAESKGLYVMGSSGDSVELLNKKDFKPRIWG